MIPVHLVSVWNPSLSNDAMQEHLRVLLRNARDGSPDDAYVWWGKVRSINRQQPQKHLEEIRALDKSLGEDDERELQLYLTDYRALWVADVEEIIEGDLPPEEEGHVPPYYREQGLACDFWFRVTDVRRLVADDLLGVIAELRKLANVHYNDRPVSLYGGMVDLPLFVTRKDGRVFFDAGERESLAGDRLWAQFDAESAGGSAATERELRDNVIGESLWGQLDPTTRTFLATGERIFRDHRVDPAFDFAPVLVSFAKAVEVEVNAVLRAVAPKLKPAVRQVRIKDRAADLVELRSLSLGQLARVIGGERELNQALRGALHNGAWFTGSLPAILEDLSTYRNAASHSDPMNRETATSWRNRLLGIGCAGDASELAKCVVR